jgi:hypothetical protein
MVLAAHIALVSAFVAATAMTTRTTTLMTTRDGMDRAATVMTARSTTLISARAIMATAAIVMITRAAMTGAATAAMAQPRPHYHALVPDGELLVLGSRNTNVTIAIVHYSGNVQGSCPC